MSENPSCRLFPRLPSEDLHHSRGRVSRLLTDARFFLAVSRPAHDWIDRNRTLACSLGLIAERGGWNSMPVEIVTHRYGETRQAKVVRPEELPDKERAVLASLDAAAAANGFPACAVVTKAGELHYLVGSQTHNGSKPGDLGTLTFTQGGPTGGYWVFRRTA